jgi:putative lipoic acid-binding regulatory protein
VQVLVQAFDTLDQDSNRTLLKGLKETDLYDAALTVMMRLVFLFSAEERGLLHLGKPLYDDNYAVSTLMEQLQEVADLYGPQVLERRCDAWARLLATFRAVHGGVNHQDLLMPAYGGSLFDPDRYPFLEGRAAGTKWANTPAELLDVNNRVVLHLLSSLQRLRMKVPGGGPSESRRISFRALGVEQIGHVYEGLLDHTAVRATEPVLGMKGTRDKETEIPLAKLEAILAKGQGRTG